MTIEWLDPFDPLAPFPPVDRALREPDGLLAAGGDLNPVRLLNAYRQGIFPWYEDDQPILWWSPDPRAVLYPECLHISRRLRRTLRRPNWTATFDGAYADVIAACAAPRHGARGTWITREMRVAYNELHAQGHAHSVEIRDDDGILIGGLYGVAIGRAFFGESMFSWRADASKIAITALLRHLQAWGYPLLDCQLPSPHLTRLGAQMMPRWMFLKQIDEACRRPGRASPWQIDPDLDISDWRPAGDRSDGAKLKNVVARDQHAGDPS